MQYCESIDTMPGDASTASEPGSLVHPQETSVPFGYGATYRTFLVSGCKPAVEHAGAIYKTIDDRDLKHRYGTFVRCKSIAWFVRHKTTREVRIASSRCNLRWCPLCIRTKRFVMRSSIIPWVKSVKKPKFLTFTLRHSSDSLADQLTRLYDAFKLLRRSKLWKTHINGGIWFFQVKKSDADNCWHPHIHCIAEGRYVPQKSLSDTWLKITTDSNIVDIRAVKNAKATADYVSRYATSPCELSSLSTDDSIEVVDALDGRRMCGTFGSGKEIQLVPKKCPDADDWEDIGTYWSVVNFRHLDDNANAIFSAWRTSQPTEATMYHEKPPPNLEPGALTETPVTYKQQVIEWNNFY